MKNNDRLTLNPVAQYTPPALPTLADKPQLKKLPSRWRKNAAVVTCIGLAGSLTLSTCANLGGPAAVTEGTTATYVTRLTEQETTSDILESTTEFSTTIDYLMTTMAATDKTITKTTTATRVTTTAQATTALSADLQYRAHYGGSGAGPQYVVYFTEQEAWGIIRAQLEAAGLSFNATPPGHTVDVTWIDPLGHNYRDTTITTSLDLYDADHRVAVAFSEGGSWFAEQAAEKFARARQTRNIAVGVFYNPGESVHNRWYEDEVEPPTDEQKAAAVPKLRANLDEQVQSFIAFLRAEEIL